MPTAFQIAADSHDVLSQSSTDSSSFLDSASDLITKALPATAIAAVNELSNIPASIGNWIGGDESYKITTNRAAIEGYDSDLARYYDDHQLGIDTAGFIVSSLAPGMAAVKGYRAGQLVVGAAVGEGTMGSMTAAAFGLKAPSQQRLVAEAIRAIGNEGKVFSLTDSAVVRALGSGVWQNAMEGAVFTGAVNATMYNSPILDQRTTSDLMWDVVIGGAFGGILGGAISGIGAAAQIKRGLSKVDEQMMPWAITSRPADSLLESDKMLFKLQQIDSLPAIAPEMEFAQRAGRTAQQTKNTLWGEVRGHVNALTHGDDILTKDVMMDLEGRMTGNGGFDSVVQNYLESTAITRVSVTSGAEKAMKKALDTVSGKTKLGLQATADEVEAALKFKVAFVDMRTGAVLSERPGVLNLADKADIVVLPGGRGVQVGKKLYYHDNNQYRPFNIMGMDHQTVQSRYVWAENLPKWADDGSAVVHETDIPLLQKAQRDGLTKLKVIPESGLIDESRVLNSIDEIASYTRTKQKELADRLMKAEVMVQDMDTLIDKIKHYTGINFNLVDDPAAGYNGMFKRLLGQTNRGKPIMGDAITLEKQLLSKTIKDIFSTLKHEEGHSIFQSLLDSRGVGRMNFDTTWPALREEVARLSKLQRPGLWKAKDIGSREYRESAHEMFADSFSYLAKNPAQLAKYPEFNKFAGHLIRPIPQEILDAVSRRVSKPSSAEVAKVFNMSEDLITNKVQNATEPSLYNVRQALKDEAAKIGKADPNYKPAYAKVITTSSRMKDVDGNLIQGMGIVAQKQELYRKSADAIVDNATANMAGEILPDARGLAGKPMGVTTGPSLLGFEAGNYGTLSSFFSYVGQRAHNLIKTAKEATAEVFNPTLMRMATKVDDAIEFSVLNEKMRGLPNAYHLSDDGTKLVYGKLPLADDFVDEKAFERAMVKYQEKLAEAAESKFPLEIEIQGADVRKLIADHIEKNNYRRGLLQKVHSNNGYQDRFDEGVFYPIPRNPKDTPYFAFVIDDTVGATGHSKMIYAKDAETLEQMRNSIMSDPKLRERGLRVLTKTESEEYYKSIGQFEFERTLSDNYINTALARKGASQSFIPVTDPKKIVTDFLDWHQARDAALMRTLVEHKYAHEFAGFRALSDPAMQASKSRFGYISPLSFAENSVNNPAANLMKMALDISKVDEYPLWTGLNKFLDGAFSKLTDDIGSIFSKAKSPKDLDEIYSSLKRAGYTDVIDAETLAQANQTVPRGTLSAIVNKANSIIATFALRSDPFNALNNAVGSSVLLGTETKAVLRAIENGSEEAVGELAKLAKILVPGGKGTSQISATKLIAKRIADFHNDKAGREWFKKHGFISSITDQYDQTLDHISIAIARGDSAAIQKAMDTAKTLGDTAEKWTANKLAEEFNRYVAAGVMKDLTDVAVKHGVMSPKTALSYINTFVNRTQGNYLASQRPILFQGPLGQAMGLFQTYQFNMLQQIFRHIGDKNVGNVATMMGLQAGVYGMNGLPAFNAINTHIIGQAGGNPEHQNMYDAIFSGAGKEAGEWLLYGGLSNGLGLFHPDLKSNIYSRGDINPRHVTLVPVDPSKTPIYQATERLLNNLHESYQKVSMGADVWSTLLRGIEQNGISRPLAGLAQVLEGAGRDDKKVVSTNQQGNMLMAHDLFSLSSLMRVAGAKPLDEAIVNDTMFRVNTYRTADAAKRKVLSEGIKNSILGGKVPDESQVNEFAEAYARTGGKQKEFAHWMATQYKNAEVSQAEQLRQKVGNPQSTSLQVIMDEGDD